jgi:hypothetical protein
MTLERETPTKKVGVEVNGKNTWLDLLELSMNTNYFK